MSLLQADDIVGFNEVVESTDNRQTSFKGMRIGRVVRKATDIVGKDGGNGERGGGNGKGRGRRGNRQIRTTH